jgi:hypothetical protein
MISDVEQIDRPSESREMCNLTNVEAETAVRQGSRV